MDAALIQNSTLPAFGRHRVQRDKIRRPTPLSLADGQKRDAPRVPSECVYTQYADPSGLLVWQRSILRVPQTPASHGREHLVTPIDITHTPLRTQPIATGFATGSIIQDFRAIADGKGTTETISASRSGPPTPGGFPAQRRGSDPLTPVSHMSAESAWTSQNCATPSTGATSVRSVPYSEFQCDRMSRGDIVYSLSSHAPSVETPWDPATSSSGLALGQAWMYFGSDRPWMRSRCIRLPSSPAHKDSRIHTSVELRERLQPTTVATDGVNGRKPVLGCVDLQHPVTEQQPRNGTPTIQMAAIDQTHPGTIRLHTPQLGVWPALVLESGKLPLKRHCETQAYPTAAAGAPAKMSRTTASALGVSPAGKSGSAPMRPPDTPAAREARKGNVNGEWPAGNFTMCSAEAPTLAAAASSSPVDTAAANANVGHRRTGNSSGISNGVSDLLLAATAEKGFNEASPISAEGRPLSDVTQAHTHSRACTPEEMRGRPVGLSGHFRNTRLVYQCSSPDILSIDGIPLTPKTASSHQQSRLVHVRGKLVLPLSYYVQAEPSMITGGAAAAAGDTTPWQGTFDGSKRSRLYNEKERDWKHAMEERMACFERNISKEILALEKRVLNLQNPTRHFHAI